MNESLDKIVDSKHGAMSLSVCICTFNRAVYLREMLQGFLNQRLEPGDEILVINNNCSDNTSLVIAEYHDALPIREVFERQQGLSRARNTALNNAKGDAIIFFDDDIFVGEGTVNAFRARIRENRQHGFFGGKVDVAWPEEKAPSWWSSEDLSLLSGLLIHYDLGQEHLVFGPSSRLPYGANFALTKETVNQVGEFKPELGVVGKAIDRGEESDYFARALNLGISGLYVPNALVLHRFEPHRLAISYLFRYGFAKGKSSRNRSKVSAMALTLSQLIRGAVQTLIGRRGYAMQCVIMAGIYCSEGFSSKHANTE